MNRDSALDSPLDVGSIGEDVTVDVAQERDEGVDAQVQTVPYVPNGCSHMVFATPRARRVVRGDSQTLGAAPMPRNVHVNFAADPSRTAAFVWSTDADTLASVVRYGTAPNELTSRAVGHVSTGGNDPVTVHEVHVCDLRPATTYYYRVGADAALSAVQSFRTAPSDSNTPVNFAFCGDSRNDAVVWRQVNGAILQQSGMRQPDALLFSGDAVEVGLIQSDWETWFNAARSTLSVMPFIMAHGNHEGVAMNYLLQFAQPQVPEAIQSELYFSYDYGPVHLVVLNDTGVGSVTELLENTERVWLEQDLMRASTNRARVPWIVVFHHKGAFSSAVHTQDADTAIIRRVYPPIFARYGVDLVLNGHDHHFELTHPLAGDGTRAGAGTYGVSYVTAAASGAPLYNRSVTMAWTKTLLKTVNFGLLTVDRTRLRMQGFRVDAGGMPSPIANACIENTRQMDGQNPRNGVCP
jgi:hypothetical protein